MSYCFRVRFRLSRVRIHSDAEELLLHKDGDERVLLQPTTNVALQHAELLALRGERYATEVDARHEGERWASRLRVGFARLGIGADFGERSHRGMVMRAGLQMMERMTGERVLADAPGVLVFECDPPPRWASVGPISPQVGKPVERVLRVLRAAAERDLAFNERETLAFDLYSASFSETHSEPRFLLLMMAVETLVEQQERGEAVANHVNDLIDQTRNAQLPAPEIDSLVGSLDALKKESVGRAGRRLAASVGDRRYMDGQETALECFTRCYEMRSQLVHGHFPRPEIGDVSVRAAALERFVGDLLGAALLDLPDE